MSKFVPLRKTWTGERIGALLACVLFALCGIYVYTLPVRTEAEKACRDWMEYAIDTPSTISRYRDESEPAEVGPVSFAYQKELCPAIGWPSDVCAVLSALPGTLSQPTEGEASKSLGKMLEDNREADKRARLNAYRSLSAEQKQGTRINVSFDADNTYGAPIRYEAYCTVKEDPDTGKPYVLGADFTRGF
ncbi:hypothetical protein [Erythrobacter aureus]|uniref:Uncharacterized protein n=1 Tax=Erythrobacter aureus TaxID=2182384 RepID=A0A345YJ94_9SPHN|nr:hypothetical protein [Erythrobacter aureus]AXK43996.1 hypothetical protein DVR09_16205 [Erythrobacter aureus]